MTPTPSAAPATFPAFPSLPADIRHQIWQTASTTSTAPGVCILTLSIPLGAPQRARHAPLIVHPKRNPSLLQTSTEAYDIVASNPPPAPRPFNPAVDTLYLGPNEFGYFTDHLNRLPAEEVPWYTEIRHLALSLQIADRGLALPYTILYNLHKLETVAVVYPGAEGTWDYQDDAPPLFVVEEGDDGNVLRGLREEEMAGCVVEADDVLEQHGWDERVVWRKTAAEHVGYIRTRMNDSMASVVRMEQDVRRIPGVWDASRRCLRVEWRAAVWDEGVEWLDFYGEEEGEDEGEDEDERVGDE
ncbi:hypothetical protein OQA88_8131 [Cercophora sp. LCS_1]